jgi:hypothetical protein
MLTNEVQQLLVAYVDSELSPRQRETVSRLLKKSAEARDFVHQLEEDAAAIRALPRRQLRTDFPQKVLDAIGERLNREWAEMAREHSPLTAHHSRLYPARVGIAAAACVLLALGIGATIYYYTLPEYQQKQAVAKNDLTRQEKPADGGSVVKLKDTSPNPATDTQLQPRLAPPPDITKRDDKPIVARNQPILEFTSETEVTLETEPTSRLELFKQVEPIGFSLVFTLRQLEQPEIQERLKETLKDNKAFHLDLTCPTTAKGLDRLQGIFEAKGVKLLIDKAALTRWQKGLKTHYAFYTEDLTPEELTAILQALRTDDKKADPKQRFNKIVINHLTPANRNEICTLLGVDPRITAAKPKGPLGVDLTQPLSKKTEEQVAESLAGKGTPRPEPGKPIVPKGPDRFALVLSYNPVRIPPASSKEIKQFLATRPGQRPGAVQILLVLRGS